MWSRRLIALIAALLVVGCSTPAATPGPTTSGSAASTSTAPPSAAASEALDATSSASAAPPTWAALDSVGPPAREDHTWTVDPEAEIAYLFGGRDGDVVFGDLWAYDLATDTWDQLVATGPAARFGHEAVWVEGTGLVTFAGQAGPTDFFNDLWAYDPGSSSWRALPSSGAVPVARYGTCAGIGPDGRLWISHGFTAENARFADTVAYDFASGTWTVETPEPPVPVNRCLHGCWWTDTGELALYGGQTTGAAALGDLWLLEEGAWTRVDGARPVERNLYARARLVGGTLVFGGQTVDRSYLADAFLFGDGEPDVAVLEIAGPGPAPRAGSEMVVDARRDRVLLFGGRDAERAYADLWELRGVSVEG